MEKSNDLQKEIPSQILKLLSDKTQEKKKEGMNDLENFFNNIIKETTEEDLICYVDKFKILSESSQAMNVRKSGYLGYICLINVLKRTNFDPPYTKLIDPIMKNILVSLKDNDTRIVSAGAECLYNLMNFFKEYVLMNFNDFLEGLLSIVTVDDSEVRGISQNLDSSLKGVINYAFQGDLPSDFNLLNFFKIIVDKINLKHPDIKCIIVSWISCINQIPEIKLINVLHLFLPELFNMLSDPKSKVNKSAEDCLQDFYDEIESGFDTLTYDVEVKILEILIEKCQMNDLTTKLKAFKWIQMFLQKYSFLIIQTSKIKNNYNKSNMIKNSISTVKIKSDHPGSTNNLQMFFSPKEPIFELENSKLDDFSLINTNSFIESERRYPFAHFAKILDIVIVSSNGEEKTVANEVNTSLMTIMDYFSEGSTNIKLFEEVLMKFFSETSVFILNLVFEWVKKLFKKFHEEAFINFNEFMNNFTNIISHDDKKIFEQFMAIICEISKYKEDYIEIIISNIIDKLRKNTNLLKDKGDIIVTNLCNALKVDKVYSTFANVLLSMNNEADFVGRMINILDLFLLTSKITEEMRNVLKNVKKTTDVKEKEFFEKLFRTWCINPVSSLILCLIAEYFELSYYLLIKL